MTHTGSDYAVMVDTDGTLAMPGYQFLTYYPLGHAAWLREAAEALDIPVRFGEVPCAGAYLGDFYPLYVRLPCRSDLSALFAQVARRLPTCACPYCAVMRHAYPHTYPAYTGEVEDAEPGGRPPQGS
jgi:hypothetical protein